MQLQRRLLRLMLWMLALSAAAGVLAVFLSTRIMGRVACTALVSAVIIAIAMPMSRMLDDEKKRHGGLLGLGSIILAFIAALAAIWIDLVTSWWDFDERLALTSVILVIGGPIAGALLARFAVPWARWAARVALAADLGAMGLYLMALWTRADEPAATATNILCTGATASLALLGIGIEPRHWRWLGVLASIIALALGIIGTWFIHSDDPTYYIVAISAAAVIAHAIVVLRIPLGEARFWTLIAAIGSTAATGGCISVLSAMTAGFDVPGPDLLTRLTGALAIVSACSTLAVVVIYRLNRRPPGASAVVSEITGIQITCPHCARRAQAAIGNSACPACGLEFSITIREPRCAKCDYPLLDIRGQTCPECGTARGQAILHAR